MNRMSVSDDFSMSLQTRLHKLISTTVFYYGKNKCYLQWQFCHIVMITFFASCKNKQSRNPQNLLKPASFRMSTFAIRLDFPPIFAIFIAEKEGSTGNGPTKKIKTSQSWSLLHVLWPFPLASRWWVPFNQSRTDKSCFHLSSIFFPPRSKCK